MRTADGLCVLALWSLVAQASGLAFHSGRPGRALTMTTQSDRRAFVGFASSAGLAAVAALSRKPAFAADSGLAGEYSDPNHPRGFRTVTVEDGVAQIAGKDEADGPTWKLVGKLDGNNVLIDFTPKGGPKNLLGKFDGSGIVFPDGNRWPKTSAITGEYADSNHPDGFRTVTVVNGQAQITGKDDPKAATWKLTGKLDGSDVLIDFSPKGGPKDLLGKFDGSGIVFPDGNRWPKVN